MNLNEPQFQKMADAVKKPDGGFSEHAYRSKAPTEGYVVSVPGYEHQIRSENVTPAHIKEFALRHQDQLTDPDRYVGGWNGGKGEVSLDVSDNIKGKKSVANEYGHDVADADARTTAADLTVARNQEAGWDVKRKKEIPNPVFDPARRKKPTVS